MTFMHHSVQFEWVSCITLYNSDEFNASPCTIRMSFMHHSVQFEWVSCIILYNSNEFHASPCRILMRSMFHKQCSRFKRPAVNHAVRTVVWNMKLPLFSDYRPYIIAFHATVHPYDTTQGSRQFGTEQRKCNTEVRCEANSKITV
jgi:hypothetical protein